MTTHLNTVGRTLALALLALALVGLWPRPAQAYGTRIHIVLANEVHDRLSESGDNTIGLRLGSYRVQVGLGDAQAILDHPEAFRAGAIGPDNFVFPAMTDPSHAIHLHPYEQCEELYLSAVLPEERAYAIGCFLHGASDAVVHHLVNYFTGETFTLTPISADRQQDNMNVVRHILAESMIQDAAVDLDPSRFTAGQLSHEIPASFALRMYMREDSAVWQLMASHAVPKFEAAKAANPGGTLQDWVLDSDQAPADHMVMIPRYMREADLAIEDMRAWVQSEVVRMQDHGDPADGSVLLVGAGPDGVLGTGDDTTDCSVTCPTRFATYFTYVGMLVDRTDASGQPLPPAFEKVAQDLRQRLQEFFPAYIQTVQNFSTTFNTPLAPGDPGLNLEPAALTAAFQPVTAWADRLVTIDYTTVAQSVLPSWVLTLDSWLDNLGINLGIEEIVQAIIQPYVDQVRAIIYDYVIGQARTYLEEIKAVIDAEEANINNEYLGLLTDAAPVELTGETVLDHLYDSGLWIHSFNITAAALAEHGVVLPDPGDPYAGPISFDTSYSMSWMQAGVCANLQPIVLPLGLDLSALLSVEDAGTVYAAVGGEDSPVECHDGALNEFDPTPDAASCGVVDLDTLLATPIGSVSRGYPPEVVGETVGCRHGYVPGLPEPEPEPEPDGGVSTPDSGVSEPDAGTSGGGDKGGCQAAGTSEGAPLVILLLGVLAVLGLRRRRRGVRTSGSGRGLALLAAVALSLGLAACDGDSGGDDPTDAGVDATGPGPDGDTPMLDAWVPPPDADTTLRDQLLADLADSVWSGTASRDGVIRALELHFRASELRWAELQNPYGPARQRELRALDVQLDGITVETVVINDDLWPYNPENGRTDTWTFEILPGAPRTLRLTRGGVVEEFTEEPWSAPVVGLTAEVRTFPAGDSSVVANAFCISGGSFDYGVLLGFARGAYDGSDTQEMDFRVGSNVYGWPAGPDFAVTDIDGMRDNGGTLMSEQANFFVRWRGQIEHPGGDICMREGIGSLDDSVEDAVWVFLGNDVGSTSDNDLFLEVHGFFWPPDATSDDPCSSYPAGLVEVEVIMVRCAVPIEEMDLAVSLGGGPWQALGDALTYPDLNPTLFPAPL